MAKATTGFETSAFTSTSWLGNTWPATDDRLAVQRTISDIAVSPDGEVFTYSFFKGGAYRLVSYQDGRRKRRLSQGGAAVGGQSVALDGRYVYVDDVLPAERGPRITRLAIDADEPPASVSVPGNDVRGLAVSGGELFVSDHGNGQVLVFSTSGFPAPATRMWRVPRAGELALDGQGVLWVVQEKEREGTQPGSVLAFDARTGAPRPEKTIVDVEDPRDLAVDGQGHVWVADGGPSSQLKAFSDRTSKLVRTFGVAGGVLSEPRGRVGPGRLNEPNALAIDARGVLYVNNNLRGLGAMLEAYAPDGRRLWVLQALGAIYDSAALDPTSDADVYGKAFHFRMDWARPPGEEAELRAFLEDPFAHQRVAPWDPKERDSPLSITWGVRAFAGRRYLITTQDDGATLAFHLLGGGPGEIARPAVVFGRRGGGTWPPGQPAGGPWIWRDLDGDGRFGAGEYEGSTGAVTLGDWWVDVRGDVWALARTTPAQVWRWSVEGVDDAGVPSYRQASKATLAVPAPFTEAASLAFDPTKDALFLSGYTAANPRGTDPGSAVGRVLARYDGGARLQWERPLEMNAGEIARVLVAEGDYVFVSALVGAVVRVYAASTGALVATLAPPAGDIVADREVGPMTVGRRRNGEYVCFVDEGFYRKVIIHRWHPRAAQGLQATFVNGRVRLGWRPPVEGGDARHHVYRSRESRRGYVRLTSRPVSGQAFEDAMPPGGAVYYRLATVEADGRESAHSYETRVDVP